MAVSYTFQSSAGSSADASSYNFTVDLGTAASDRKILAGVFSNAGTAADPTSVTINGVGATKLSSANGPDQGANFSWWIADVPTGTTGVTINATWGSNRTRAGVAVWPIYGSASVSLDVASSAPSGTVTIDIAADRYVFAMSHIRHSAQYYFGIGDDYFASASAGHSITANLTSFTGITYRTRQSIDSGGTVNQLAAHAISLIITAPVPAITKDLTIKWGVAFDKDLTIEWQVFTDGVEKSLTLIWDIAQPIAKNLSLVWGVRLYKDLRLRWRLLNVQTTFYDYQVIVPSAHSPLISNWDKTPSIIDDWFSALSSGLVIPSVTPLPAIESLGYLYFYGDYYLRIWLDPSVIRLSNPRINVEISFNLWNAFPNANELIEAIDTDLTGVQLEFTLPVSFLRYEYKTLGFSITPDAPARIDGSYEFLFTDGDALLRIIATIIEVANILPTEPIIESWIWKTNVITSHDANEKRYALRSEPRSRLNYTVFLPDEADRRKRYAQLWTFLSRDLRMPLFQYAVRLDQDANLGDTKLYLDPALGDFRDNEFMALVNTETQTFKVVRVATVDLDGLTLEAGLDEDISSYWLAVPTIAMRIPDGSGLRMDAKTGEASINAESVQYRTLVRPDSAAVITTFDGFPVLDLRPIAVDALEESFEQGTEVVDNDMALPAIHSFWDTPFINGSRQWKIDRDTDMDFWREFCQGLAGMQNSFLLPTWRSDLELLEDPFLSSNLIQVVGTDYILQWENETYKRIQLETRNGIIYRKITSYEDPGDGTLILTLNSPIGSEEGDNLIQRVSFLNVARLDSDTVTLEHLTNWTIVTLQVRTINE